MNMPDGFWTTQLQGNIADEFSRFLGDATFEAHLIGGEQIDDEYPALLSSARTTILAESQMFFDEPWVNIEYQDREREVARLYNEYRDIISLKLDADGADMDELFKIDRQTMYDEFPDAWDSPVAYELGERVHLWVEPNHTWFLGEFQEDKELPIEIRFGRFNADDMKKLTEHMRAFSAF